MSSPSSEQKGKTEDLRFRRLPPAHSHWLQDDLMRRLFKNASILLSGNIGASLLGLVSLALTARALGAESFGILVLITTYVLVVDRFVNFQSWQALIKYGAEAFEQSHDEDFKTLIKFGFSLDISTAMAGAFIAACGAWFVGHWQEWDSEVVLLTTLYSTTVLFHVAGAPTAILRLFDRFKLFSLITITSAAIKLVGVTLAFLSGAGLWAFLLAWAATDILGKILLVALSLRELRQRNYLHLRRARIRGMMTRFPGIWSFVVATNINSSIRMASREADILVVGALLTPSAVGLYKIAKQLAGILGILSIPLNQSIYPELAKLHAKRDNRGFISLALRSTTLAGGMALLISTAVVVLAEPLLHYVFGAEFVAAKGVMLWYMCATVMAVAGFPLTPMILALGKPVIAFWNYFVSTTIYFLALYWLLVTFGLVGAGMAYVVFYLVWSSLALLIVYKVITKERRE